MSRAKPFHFSGAVPASKSILNRLLIVQSYFPELEIKGESRADDVVKMKSALRQLEKGEPADCGSAGTTLRFLALKAARMGGSRHLSGTLRLFERPHGELAKLISQLGAEAEFGRQRLTVRGKGWSDPGRPITVDRSLSSQFASALCLNAWDLPFDLHVHMEGELLSESYFQMTYELLKNLGMHISIQGADIQIARGSRLKKLEWKAEPDFSSAFALAAYAVASGGSAEFSDWPVSSLQPDFVFPEILERMGCSVEKSLRRLKVSAPSGSFRAVEWSLREAPDLFPVLAVLCSLAPGRSKLFGASQLAHKESDRLAKTSELVALMGRRFKLLPDGIEIDGSVETPLHSCGTFDTDHDHRLAMAGAVARAAGFAIELSDIAVVSKSFPEFCQIVGEQGALP